MGKNGDHQLDHLCTSGCPTACHIEMLRHPDQWTHFPVLPMKRWRSMMDVACAVLCGKEDAVAGDAGNVLRLVIVNLFELGWMDPELRRGLVLASPARTAEEIVADGWVVD